MNRLKVFVKRAILISRFYWPRLKTGARWLLHSRETTNHTYCLTARNKEHLAFALSIATGSSPATVRQYFSEIETDAALRSFIADQIRQSPHRNKADPEARYGRRLVWYAAARILKPTTIVETGVDKGLGSVVLCAALRRNAIEGHPGRYFGTDINPEAGYLLQPPYSEVGTILYGDSIESLTKLTDSIGLFVNDSDHSQDYERREYECIESRLSGDSLIIGDNAHATDTLANFSEERGRQFLFAGEQPVNHWYPGAGVGLSFK
ncbi:class I SAM-dependent methyltransferase [Pelagibius litoralis]|uniref:Class I SAM-dependent methyltransferase n=1 Tax=Pelagibius litoralis TaxID=374515 RepID=A0A967KFF0_9PROT|nr:class I SAM-dependent methyltransferase [Pelagibius litoralis]NIA72419.1 class I SAM-dependent methyltransferase [Pelagibius litoralis]